MKFIFLSGLTVSLAACMNPSKVADQEAETLKQNHPGDIREIQGRHHVIRFVVRGRASAQPVMFVHGSPGSWEGWAHFLNDPIFSSNLNLIAIDRAGYGGSDPGHSETSLESQADDVVDVLKDVAGGRPAILVGHSYGGPVIAKVAMIAPERINGLVFVAASVDPAQEKTKWYQYPASWWPLKWLIPTSLRVCNEEIFGLKAELTKMLPDWPKIRAKTVLIQGVADPLVPIANLDFLIQHLDPKIVVGVSRIEGLNHFVPWKRPDLISQGIQELVHAPR